MQPPIELLFIAAGALLLVSALATKASIKLGVPALLLFIGIGILAGSEGLGGIYFDDYDVAREMGTFALAFILFAGGLDTKWDHIKPVLRSGISLATIGVGVTAGIVGVAAAWLLHIPLLSAFLLGAIVSSTDASAVFSVLRTQNISLKGGLQPVLELESGCNDPMAVFFTVAITDLIVHPGTSALAAIPTLVMSMAIGLLIGVGYGRVGAWLINQLRFDLDGLYPAITMGIALLSFGTAWLANGNEFLAIYVTALVLGNSRILHKQSLIAFHDALAWLMQIGMFLMLGLLVFPSHLPPIALPGMALAMVLVLVARPAAVFLSLSFSRWTTREKLLLSWTGLRGAVPIILATIPLTEGVSESGVVFNVVFFAVLVSVLLQGSLIGRVAEFLGVREQHHGAAEHGERNMAEVTIVSDSPAAGKRVMDLDLPRWALIVLVDRRGESFAPQGSTRLQLGDRVLIATRKEDLSDITAQIAGLNALPEGDLGSS